MADPTDRSQRYRPEDIHTMVHRFYDQVRDDAELGPIFNTHVSDWPTHLDTMVRFWSSLLLGTGQYSGTPMARHAVLPQLSAALFERWLALFNKTLATLPDPQLAEKAGEYAQRIARSLWFGYQLHQQPERTPQDLA